ncbi:MAG: hypothetical protein ACRCSG_09625 [Cellulosilyticaceae bacterium]
MTIEGRLEKHGNRFYIGDIDLADQMSAERYIEGLKIWEQGKIIKTSTGYAFLNCSQLTLEEGMLIKIGG